MKKLIILFAIMLSLVGCANGDDSNNAKVEEEANKIDNVTPLEEEGPEEQEQVSDGDENYLNPCDIWLCDADWGDWNSYDEE